MTTVYETLERPLVAVLADMERAGVLVDCDGLGARSWAFKLAFEGFGLLIAWRIFRSLFRNPPLAGQAITVVIAIVVGLSCYGIWQHHYFYAEQSEWYLSLRNELDLLLARRDASQLNRLDAITQQLQEHDIPVYGAGRILW